MNFILLALALASFTQDAPSAGREPQHWTMFPWARAPQPVLSPRDDFAQAELTCSVGAEGRPDQCRLDRVMPEGSSFGREALRSMRRARIRPEHVQAGDTGTFTIWGCTDLTVSQSCQKRPWPEAETE